MACGVGQADQPVVIAVPGVVAPAVMVALSRLTGRRVRGPRDPVAPEQHVSQRPSPSGRCAVALALQMP